MDIWKETRIRDIRRPWSLSIDLVQGCISCVTCSYPELTEDHVLTSAYVKIFRTVTRNAVNKSVWRKKDCSWIPLNKYAMNIWLSSLRIRPHLSWKTGNSELTPRAPIPDGRMAQIMQPWSVTRQEVGREHIINMVTVPETGWEWVLEPIGVHGIKLLGQ